MNDNFFIIAIDGTAASGKSTTATLLSERLNLLNVSTGEHYRALSYILNKKQIPPEFDILIVEFLQKISLHPTFFKNKESISVDGEVFTKDILRSEEVNNCVSQYAKNKKIRKFLHIYQKSLKNFAQENKFKGLVVEGRDITGVVFPDADYKFFLFADVDDRINRRNNEKLNDCIKSRDNSDSKHMMIDKTVVEIDTSENNLSHVVEIIYSKILKKQ